ncbi:MAG: hypothetical protein H0U76_18560 [Ktedonobacteraceae bacterium]|nr:hypothetical protein [Ktedonobacteraceae bacterium]
MGKRHMLAFASLFLSALWLWAVFAFDKWAADWWGISIWVFAILLALIFVGIAVGLSLFDVDASTPALVICGLALFIVLSLGEGVFVSEPGLHQVPSHSTASSSDEGSHSNFFYYYWHESTTGSSSSSSSHSNSKGAEYVILFLLLIALLILSAIIPHFWVVAVFIGLALLWGFTIKEFRLASEDYS